MKHLVKLLLLFVVLVLGAVFFKTQQVNSSAQDQQKIWNLSVGFDTDQVEPGVPFDDMPLVKEIRALQREDLGVFLDYRQVLIITDSIISPEGADLSAFSGPSAMKKRGEILYAVGDEVFGINKGSIDELNLTESEQTYTNRLVSIVADIKNGKGDQHFQVEYLASRYAVVQASVNDGLVLFADRSAIQEKYDQYYEDELARLKQEGNGTQQNSERSVLIGTSTITTRSGSCPYEPKESGLQRKYRNGQNTSANASSWYHARQESNSNDCDLYIRAYTQGNLYPYVEPTNPAATCVLGHYGGWIAQRVSGNFQRAIYGSGGVANCYVSPTSIVQGTVLWRNW